MTDLTRPFIGYPRAPKPALPPAAPPKLADSWLDNFIQGFIGMEPTGSVLEERKRDANATANDIGQRLGLIANVPNIGKAALGGILVGASSGMQEIAKKALRKGASARDILEDTGLVQVPNGSEFFPAFGKQLDSTVSALNLPALAAVKNGQKLKLGEVLDFPELFEHYPRFETIDVKSLGPLASLKGLSGSWDHRGTLSLAPPKYLNPQTVNETHGTMIHELQHAVQGVEGWQAGGNPGMFTLPSTKRAEHLNAVGSVNLDEAVQTILNQNGINREHTDSVLRDALYYLQRPVMLETYSSQNYKDAVKAIANNPEIMRESGRLNKLRSRIYDRNYKAFDGYQNLAGEAQARAATELWSRGPAGRNTPMTELYDVPSQSLIFQDPMRALPRLK